MSSSGQNNIYSQGINFGSFIQKGVDPRTGQYTFGITVYESPSKTRNCPPLKLSLAFNPLAPQNVGLGAGWFFNLSRYQHREANNRILSLSTGEKYQVLETADNVVVKDQKLKNFQFVKKTMSDENGSKTAVYQTTYKSGLTEILSNANDTFNVTVPVELYAESGRSLQFLWTPYGEQPRLAEIQEEGQELLTVDYTDAHIDLVRNPGTDEASTLSLMLANDRLMEIRLPLEDGEDQREAWAFTYETFNQSITCLSTVTSPAGLLEEVRYNPNGHRLPAGAPFKTIPYAVSHTARPGNQQPAMETRYSFSDNSFLGYNGCESYEDGEDNLYRVPDEYQYTSTVQVQGGMQTQYTYNKFHLISKTQQQNGSKKIIQDISYYALLYKEFKDQPSQYLLPKHIRTTYLDTTKKTSRVETSQHVFDEWGNPTREIAANGTRTDRVYYPSAGEKDKETEEVHCPADPNGFWRYLKKEVVTAAENTFQTPTRGKKYTYRQIPAATGGTSSRWLVVVQQMDVLEDRQSISSTLFTFVNDTESRDHGRLQETTTQLSGQYPKTQSWTYEYSGTNQLLSTVSTKFFDNLTVQEKTRYSLFTGRAIEHKDKAGNLSHFTYDKLGRLVELTASPCKVTQQRDYAILRNSRGHPLGCCITITDAKGVKIRHFTDGLERIVRTERQDDNGQLGTRGSIGTYNGTFRLVQERFHNAQGKCIQVVDIDWMTGEKAEDTPRGQRSTRSFEYDDWGQVCRVIQGSGVVSQVLVDPISLTRMEGIEGEGKYKTTFNVSGLPTQRASLEKDGSCAGKEEYAYDGLGRLMVTTNLSNHTKLISHDCFDRITQTTWPDGHSTTTRYAAQSADALPTKFSIDNDCPFAEQAFDGLGRLAERTIGGRTSKHLYRGNEPEPTETTTPNGSKYDLAYNPTLGNVLTSMMSKDIAYSYLYDTGTTALRQFKDAKVTGVLQYLPSGMLSEEIITDGGMSSTTRSIYSMAGKLLSYTDVNGQRHEIQYDGFGRPQQLTQGKLKVTFSYDEAGRLSTSCATDEASSSSLTTHLEYDGFRRETERTVVQMQKDQPEKMLYQLSQTYDMSGLLSARLVKDDEGNLLRHETFQYDSLNRLIDYQSKGCESWLSSDGKGNRLRRQKFTFDVYNNLTQAVTVFQDGSINMAFYTYSRQDHAQVLDIYNTHPSYSSQIRLDYNTNGCLIRDEQGRVLEYDTLNRLTAVLDACDKSRVLCRYEYDATGKLIRQVVPGQPDTRFSYRGNTLVATATGDKQVSYACLGNTYWGQTTTSTAPTSSEKKSSPVLSQSRELWSSDFHQSVFVSSAAGEVFHQQYTPYGLCATGTSIGFNGQWRDPVTGWYHLGNGYRVYNPVLMCFHTPDTWSPFVSGEINAYAYCLGDPVNRVDPSGHLSIFGIQLSDRNLIMMGVGIAASALVGVLTGGASLAITVGLSVAASTVSDAATGAIYDLASGKSPTWESIATDALYGAIGGLMNEGIGRAVTKGAGPFLQTVKKTLGRSGSFAAKKAERQGMRRLVWQGLHEKNGISFLEPLGERPGSTGLMTYGNPGYLMDAPGHMRRVSEVSQEAIMPSLEKMWQTQPDMEIHDIFASLAGNGFSESGLVMPKTPRYPVRFFDGKLQSSLAMSQDRVFYGLEQPEGVGRVCPDILIQNEHYLDDW